MGKLCDVAHWQSQALDTASMKYYVEVWENKFITEKQSTVDLDELVVLAIVLLIVT